MENDSALDYIGSLVDRIVADLEADLATLGDGVLERTAGPCVSLLATLVESYCDRFGVTPEQVAEWRAQVSSWLAKVIASQVHDQDAWVAYKASFDAEFERLAAALHR